MNRGVLFVTALGWEAHEITRCINGLEASRAVDGRLWRGRSTDVWVLKTGVGPDRARQALGWAARTVEPRVVVSTGCGGALTSDLSIGDLAIADEVVTNDGRSIPAASAWRERYQRAAEAAGVNARSGRLLSLSAIVATADEKRRLASESHAVAVEMEAAAIGEWAIAAGAEFAACRVILDPAEMSLAPEIGAMMTPGGGDFPPEACVGTRAKTSPHFAARRARSRRTAMSDGSRRRPSGAATQPRRRRSVAK
jgi:nucleoside phosphorylase